MKSDSSAEALQEFRRDLRRRKLAALYGFLAFPIVAAFGEAVMETKALAIAWIFFAWGLLAWLARLRCPRCQKTPFHLSSLRNALSNDCGSCGAVVR